MSVDLNKALAEIAVAGLFEGMQTEAANIIDALENEDISELSRLSLRALLLLNQEDYVAVIKLLEPWCNDPSNPLDTPHAYLGLALWRNGNIPLAKQWCTRLLNESDDESTRQVARDLLLEIGE